MIGKKYRCPAKLLFMRRFAMDALRQKLINQIATMPDEDLAVLDAFLDKKTFKKINTSTYAIIATKITSFLKKYAIGHTLDGYEYLRTALHIILENPSAYSDTFEVVYEIVGKEYDCPGPFIELVINNLLINAYKTYPKFFADFPASAEVPTSNEFLRFSVKQLAS